MRTQNSKKTVRMAEIGILMALVVVLQSISSLGVVTICLCLIPITIGALSLDWKAGAVLGFAAGFLLVQVLLEKYMFVVICFFVGLMIGASPTLLKEIKGERANAKRVILMVIGILIPIAIAIISIAINPPAIESASDVSASAAFKSFPPYLFVLYVPLGILIAATQLIPGLSATAIMMAFGQFKPIMDSMHLDYILENPLFIVLIGCLFVGAVVGLIIISKIFSKLIEKHKGTTFFFVIGLSFGSIASMFFNPDTAQVYFNWSQGGFSGVEFAIGIALLAVGLIGSGLLAKYELIHDNGNKEVADEDEKDKNSTGIGIVGTVFAKYETVTAKCHNFNSGGYNECFF